MSALSILYIVLPILAVSLCHTLEVLFTAKRWAGRHWVFLMNEHPKFSEYPLPPFRNEYVSVSHCRCCWFPCCSPLNHRIVRRRLMDRTHLGDNLYGIFSVHPDQHRARCNPQRLCSWTCDQHYLRPSHRVRGIFLIPRLALVGNDALRHSRPCPRCSLSFHRSAYRAVFNRYFCITVRRSS